MSIFMKTDDIKKSLGNIYLFIYIFLYILVLQLSYQISSFQHNHSRFHNEARSSHLEVFCKKGILKNFAKPTQKHLCESLFFNKFVGLRPATLLKKDTPTQVFSCEFYKKF